MIYLHPKSFDLLKTMKVKADSCICDSHLIERSWKERLFTTPWTPWIKHKIVYCPIAYVLKDGTVLVSHKTKALLEKK